MIRAACVPVFDPPTGLQVALVGPDAPGPSVPDLRRLFSGRTLSRARRERLATATKIVARHGGRALGLAAYDCAGDDLRVVEVALEPSLCFGAQDVLHQLLDAIELAALAGGCRRIVLLPAAIVAATQLNRLGFSLVTEDCAGGWLEKRLS
jgi:hypothetical protein